MVPAKRIQSDLMEMDAVNWGIVRELKRDPQITNRALGTKVGVSEITVAARISQLCEAGAMRILLQRNIERLGLAYYGHFLIEGRASSIAAIAERIAEIRAVHSAMIIEGGRIFLTAGARDRAGLLRLIDQEIGGIKDVRNCSFTLIPNIVKFETGVGAVASHTNADSDTFVLEETDVTDKAIIDILSVDARISNREVSRRLGISESLVRVRLKKLIDGKFVKFGVVTDPRFFGETTFAFVNLRVPLSRIPEVCRNLRTSAECAFAGRSSGYWNLCGLAVYDSKTRLSRVLRDSWKIGDTESEVYEPKRVFKHRIDLVKIE
jgi:DNA-binding Lrp family transcriptional regulator